MTGEHPAVPRVGEGSTGDPGDIAAIVDVLRRAGSAAARGDADGVAGMFANEAPVTLFDFLQAGLTTVADIHRNVQRIRRDAVGAVAMRLGCSALHGSQRRFRLERRAVVPARSLARLASCPQPA